MRPDKTAATKRVLSAIALATLWLAGAEGGWAANAATSAGAAGKEEANMKNAWYTEHLTHGKSNLPFSFTYGGRPSAPLLAEWPVKVADERLDANRTRRTLTWTDPKTGLEVRCVAVEYVDYPAVEWTVYFKNTGTTNTPILEKIQGVDARLVRDAKGDEFVLHGIKGDFESA